MARDLADFQIRVFGRDGELLAYLILPAANAHEATLQAELFISSDTTRAEIWSDGALLETISA